MIEMSQANILDANATYAVAIGNVDGLVQKEQIIKLASGAIRNAPDAPITPIAGGRFAVRLKFADYVQIVVTKPELDEIIAKAKSLLDAPRD